MTLSRRTDVAPGPIGLQNPVAGSRGDLTHESSGPLAYSVKKACELTGIGRTRLYAEMASGALTARKSGTRRVILEWELRAWLERLPVVEPKLAH
jgi:excisionase family DNA binding protein